MSEKVPAASTCPECGGRGWVLEADGGAGSARPCGCRRRGTRDRLLLAAGIPPLYQRCTLEGFKTAAASPAEADQLVRARSICQRYVEEFVGEDGRFRETGLCFVGQPGVGKTHLAAAVLKELIARYQLRGLFVDFTSLVHRIQSTFDPSSDSAKHQVLDPVTQCEILVLDELGAQQPSEWVRNTLYLILNTRYTNQLTTLFTTNFRLWGDDPRSPRHDELDSSRQAPRVTLLETRIGPGLVSRICEMAKIVEIEAGDFRREVKMQRHAG